MRFALMWFSHVCSCHVSASSPLFHVCVYWFVCCISHLRVFICLSCIQLSGTLFTLGLLWRAKHKHFVCFYCTHKHTNLNWIFAYCTITSQMPRILLTLSIVVTVAHLCAWQIVIYSCLRHLLKDFCELIKTNSMTVLYGTVSFWSKQMPMTQYKLLERWWWMQSINFTWRDEIDCKRGKTRSEELWMTNSQLKNWLCSSCLAIIKRGKQ